MKNQKAYRIEVDLGDWGFEVEADRWLQLSYLEAEGDSLEELFTDATVFTQDQDGGEGPYYGVGDTQYCEELEDLIEQALQKYYPEQYEIEIRKWGQE